MKARNAAQHRRDRNKTLEEESKDEALQDENVDDKKFLGKKKFKKAPP